MLLACLEEVHATGRDEYAMKAGGFKRQLEQFDTFFGLKLSYLLFAPTEQLSRTFQAKNITVQEAHSAAQATHSYVQGKRSDKAFKEWYGEVLSASEANTDPPVLPRKRLMRRLDDGHAHTNQTQLSTCAMPSTLRLSMFCAVNSIGALISVTPE